MNTIENIKCDCGETFEWDATGLDELNHRWKPKRCQQCDDRFWAEREAQQVAWADEGIAQNKAYIAKRINDATPKLFQKTDIDHPKFNSSAWVKIQKFKLSEEIPWIGLVGMTGRCKSRMAYLYAANELKRLTSGSLPKFAFVASYEINDAVTRLHCDFAQKAEARQFLDSLREVDVLLIDDLGKGRLTPTVASELFALIDHRYVNRETTIWTSNSSPEVIASGLPEDMAGPFIGRINESSKIFTFK